MGRDLSARFPIARATFEEAEAILAIQISKTMWDGPESALNDTINTQPALYIHSLAAYRTFAHAFPEFKPAVVAGHSLGEISALAAAGAISFEDGLRLVRRRGELMKRAGELAPGGMAAVLGLDIPTLEQACLEASRPGEVVQVANDNCPGQVVISGSSSAVNRAVAAAKSAGAKRVLPLAVSIAAHSPLMDSIQVEWNGAVAEALFTTPRLPVIGNVHAASLDDGPAARADLIQQMQSRVRWTESVRVMQARGIEVFLEAGPGTVLGGLIKRILENVATLPLGNPQDYDSLA
jgi:[acyl-carrier-protein] S-malonyltransferase